MMPPTYFNDQLSLKAYKVNNVLAYGSLSAKPVPWELAIAKKSPQSSFTLTSILSRQGRGGLRQSPSIVCNPPSSLLSRQESTLNMGKPFTGSSNFGVALGATLKSLTSYDSALTL